MSRIESEHNLSLTNEERSEIGMRALVGVEFSTMCREDLECSITDLVADLLHLARENDIEPDYIIHMAQEHYQAEVEEEAADVPHNETPAHFINSRRPELGEITVDLRLLSQQITWLAGLGIQSPERDGILHLLEGVQDLADPPNTSEG